MELPALEPTPFHRQANRGVLRHRGIPLRGIEATEGTAGSVSFLPRNGTSMSSEVFQFNRFQRL
jgi:hypothetical protein